MTFETAQSWRHVVTVVLAAWFAGAWSVCGTAAALRDPQRGDARVAVRPAHVVRRVADQIVHAGGDSAFHRPTVDAADARDVRWHATGARAHRGCPTATAHGNGSRGPGS